MPPADLLRDLTVVFACAFPILFLCRRVGLPPIVGFLVTGVLTGPHGLGWLSESERVGSLAELGVVLILFFIGLEFPLPRLARLGRAALTGGLLQMSLTTLAVAGPALVLGLPAGTAVFYGLLVSLSSSAVALPALESRDEMAAPHARRFLGISLFQDLAVIPAMMLLPALAGGSAAPPAGAVLWKVAVALAGASLLVAAARWVLPIVLRGAARIGSREGFTGLAIVLVLLMVSLAERAGVSAAMGAFAAGIVVAESDYIHDIASALSPFRDILSSLFFVSIGMLVDPRFLAAHATLAAGALAAVLTLKAALGYGSLRLSGATPRTAVKAALALSSVGEFSFLLVRAGKPLGLLADDGEALFVAIAAATLGLCPILIALAPRIAEALPERVEEHPEEDSARPLSGHVVVAGYGLNGQNVASVLTVTHIPHVVLDVDRDRVAAARRAGSRALRADAAGLESLTAAGVAQAAALVVATSDADGTRRIVRLARQMNPQLRILVRTRYVSEVEALRAAGADEVIPEEFETSIEIVARILRVFHLPGNVVAAQLRLLRDEGYRRLRETTGRRDEGRRLSALMAAGTTELFLVMPDSPAEGRTLAELDLAADHVTVPAVLRDGAPLAPLRFEETLAAGDTLLLVGAHEDLARVLTRLEGGARPA